MMRFSCFSTSNIWGSSGSINLSKISRKDTTLSLPFERIQQLPEIEPDSPRSTEERKPGIIDEGGTLQEGPPLIYDKDTDSREQIKRAILKNEFLRNLEESQVHNLVMGMHPEEVDPGTFLIREGDVGNNLYVSAEGEFNVYEGERLQESFGPGVAFGELALLYNMKRLRSIEVKNGGKVWAMDRAAFHKAMFFTMQDRLEANIRYLRKIPFFEGIPEPKDDILAKISDLLKIEIFSAGTRIIRQGDEGHKFYIIRSGSVEITKTMPYGGEERLVVLRGEQYFGEQALLTKGEPKRQANAIALPPSVVECLTLDRQPFLDYIGGLEEIRNKDWRAEYEKQRKSLTVKWSTEYKDLKFSDLEVVQTLGVGGFGRVELVVSKLLPGKSFALKQMKKKVIVDKDLQESVFNEKYIMQACNSPFICKLYQTYKNSKYVYFLMEVCLGGDVWTTLQRRRKLDDSTTRFILGCAVEALDHLHSFGIVYRDLKPENLMFDSRGYVKLVDFGLSKKIGPYKTFGYAGTPEYAAPEVLMKRGHDRAVDYWALGILTYELLVGKPPFRGRAKDRDNPMPVYIKILKGLDAVGIPNTVGTSANNFIRKLLRQNRSDRLGYQRKGVQDIRDHEWFSGFNWKALRRMALSPPIDPKIRSHTDTTHFEDFPPDNDIPRDDFSDWDKEF